LQSPAAQVGDLRAVSLSGQIGTFRVLPGIESRAGRDGSMCSIHLNDPRCSGVHATLKVEGGALLVRDDKSHNGTYVNGNRIPPGTWTPVPGGSQLRFGPIEFMVRHES
jgi:pSer/pThr/pTyr-binding forkhead associated (FHA) protein